MATNVRATRAKWLLEKASVAGYISKQVLDLNSLKTFNAVLRGTGACTAVVIMEGSNLPDDDTFNLLLTMNLSTTDGVASPAKESGVYEAPWSYIRFTLVSISGTNAAVDAAVGN